MTPFKVVEDFEKALCEYTGAPFAIAVSSCTDALGICFEYLRMTSPSVKKVEIPNLTYIGVPMQAKRAGFDIEFVDIEWEGEYRIWPFNLIDSARRFYKNMYKEYADEGAKYVCVSFHASKILGYSHGGAILCNDYAFNEISRQLRFDGRTFSLLEPMVLGRHANMTPDIAAALLYKLYHLPDYNPDLPNSDYPNLSRMEIFK